MTESQTKSSFAEQLLATETIDDTTGKVFNTSGNGTSSGCNANPDGTPIYENDAVVRLSATLAHEDAFIPLDWQANWCGNDQDLGSASMVLISPTLAFQAGKWGGHEYEVAIGPEKTAMTRDGRLRFEATGGVVIRQYQFESSRLSFTLNSEQGSKVTTEEFDSGELSVRIDRKSSVTISVREGRLKFDVPPGEHAVELLR